METREVNLPGYEGLYQVTDTGVLYSLRKNKQLTQAVNSSGYLMCYLTPNEGAGHWIMAHIVVLTTFKGPKEGYEVNHIDEDKQNNNLSNLEWLTHAENIQKSYDNGRIHSRHMLGFKFSKASRDKMAKAKYKPVIVTDTRTNITIEHSSIQEVADIYSLHRKTIYRYLNAKTSHRYLLFAFKE
ncbi:MAG: HNH endonuclease [Bacteroidetes bacterium]|nr:HNH endonuclease [Bacteroidota bacterium]